MICNRCNCEVEITDCGCGWHELYYCYDCLEYLSIDEVHEND